MPSPRTISIMSARLLRTTTSRVCPVVVTRTVIFSSFMRSLAPFARRPRLGSVTVAVNGQGGVLHQPIDKKRPDTANKGEEHPPIRSDVQGGALAANSALAHEVFGGDN